MNAVVATNVLVLEPDPECRSTLAEALRVAGFTVVEAGDGMEAFAAADHQKLDLVVMEMRLPVISGLEVLAHFAERRTPVVVASSLDGEEARIRALDLGADDYVQKPYSAREVVARAKAVLRRTNRAATRPVMTFNGLTIDLDGREVRVKDTVVETTAKEFDLLAYLAASPGTVFTRDRLLQSVWHSSSAWQQPGTVTEHIRRLREKIEDTPARPKWLVTIRGVGYKFERRHSTDSAAAPSATTSPLRQAQNVERRAEARLEVA